MASVPVLSCDEGLGLMLACFFFCKGMINFIFLVTCLQHSKHSGRPATLCLAGLTVSCNNHDSFRGEIRTQMANAPLVAACLDVLFASRQSCIARPIPLRDLASRGMDDLGSFVSEPCANGIPRDGRDSKWNLADWSLQSSKSSLCASYSKVSVAFEQCHCGG